MAKRETELEIENRILKQMLLERARSTSRSTSEPLPPRKKVSVKDAPKEVDWTKVISRCSKCNHKGPVLPDFGTRKTFRGEIYKQSQCKACRAKADYYRRPRKYKSLRNR